MALSHAVSRYFRWQCGLAALTFLVAGCGTEIAPTSSTAIPQFQGIVHGGQQPVSGASIQIYAAGNSGYGVGATALLGTPAITGNDGSFSITTSYTCPSATSQLYVVASGGNPGLSSGTSNAALVLMAAAGPCGLYGSSYTYNPSAYITINEVTTVAAAYALSGFMDPVTTQVGTSAANATGLANAFQTVNSLVAPATGAALAATSVAGSIVPQSEINALANILAPCVNSDGTGTPCANLFSAATPSGGTAPSNTLQAALSIALHPYSKVSTLATLIPSSPPFMPSQAANSVTSWLLSINYLSNDPFQTSSSAFDPSGNLWTATPGSSVILKYSNTGAPLTPPQIATGGLLSSPVITFDPAGTLWVAAVQTQPTITTGVLMKVLQNATQPVVYNIAALTAPTSIAIDPSGNVWVTNSNYSGGSVFEFNTSGAQIYSNSSSAVSSLLGASGIAFDNSGDTWISGTSALTELNSSNQLLSGSSGFPFYGGPIAIDLHGNIWNGTPAKVTSSGAMVAVSPWCSLGTSSPPVCYPSSNAFALDGAGNAWGTVREVVQAGAFVTYLGIQELNNSGSQLFGSIGALNNLYPQSMAVDTSGNLWATPANFQNFGISAYITEFIGASTPMVISSVGAANHTVGMRP